MGGGGRRGGIGGRCEVQQPASHRYLNSDIERRTLKRPVGGLSRLRRRPTRPWAHLQGGWAQGGELDHGVSRDLPGPLPAPGMTRRPLAIGLARTLFGGTFACGLVVKGFQTRTVFAPRRIPLVLKQLDHGPIGPLIHQSTDVFPVLVKAEVPFELRPSQQGPQPDPIPASNNRPGTRRLSEPLACRQQPSPS